MRARVLAGSITSGCSRLIQRARSRPFCIAASLPGIESSFLRPASMRACVPVEVARDSTRRKTSNAWRRCSGARALNRSSSGSIRLALIAVQSKSANAGNSAKYRSSSGLETRRKNEGRSKNAAMEFLPGKGRATGTWEQPEAQC